MNRLVIFSLFFGLSFLTSAQSNITDYNVTWSEPSKDSWGSMPIGNGDIGANVWMGQDGDMHIYISKSDAWSENARLLKIGKLGIHEGYHTPAFRSRFLSHQVDPYHLGTHRCFPNHRSSVPNCSVPTYVTDMVPLAKTHGHM